MIKKISISEVLKQWGSLNTNTWVFVKVNEKRFSIFKSQDTKIWRKSSYQDHGEIWFSRLSVHIRMKILDIQRNPWIRNTLLVKTVGSRGHFKEHTPKCRGNQFSILWCSKWPNDEDYLERIENTISARGI